MAVWNKKEISQSLVKDLEKKYGADALTATIFARRGITAGKEILYYLEDDLRFQHSPFSFSIMEDAVDRIISAVEEHEKVLIFGDRDVDGVTATTVLYDCLKDMGIDVQYRLPEGNDAYGLSISAIDDFSKDFGSLIITVDCGISNNTEVAHAAELGIDVIIVDHHNPQEMLPSPAIIIDPKCIDSGYPFPDISGCAVVFKLVSALRFSQSKWYKQEVTLLNIIPEENSYCIDCIKLRNLIPVRQIKEHVIPGETSISQTKLPSFLLGQIILVWNKDRIQSFLTNSFGTGIEFNLLDMRLEIGAIIPQFKNFELSKIKTLSKIARYGNHAPTEIGGFYNIYVTYVQMALKKEFPDLMQKEDRDLQLVALAALSDIMPMKDENRIFVKKGLASINSGRIRPGLLEIMSVLNMLGKHISSTDVSWTIVSNLNAAGRLGHPELAADLFISNDPSYREMAARKIKELNAERKQLSQDAWDYAGIQAQTSIPLHNDKLCVVIDERINRGVSGIVAGRLVSLYNIPAITATFVGQTVIGSMRSCRGLDSSDFLNRFGDIFINHGGHTCAAGFSFLRDRLPEFEQKLIEESARIELEKSTADIYEIDAEIPSAYLTPDILNICDTFEPFGEKNPQLLFMSKKLKVIDAMFMGKTEKQHLKLIINTKNNKWPALFWNEGERLHRDFEIGDEIDILYHIERNTFNGIETPQLILVDLKKSAQ